MSSRRSMQWFDQLELFDINSGDTHIGALLLGHITTPSDSKGLTLTRLVGRMQFTAAVPNGAPGVMGLQFGIALAGEDAIAEGEAALSNINVDTEQPPSGYLIRDEIGVSGSSTASRPPSIGEIKFDIRAQRKLMYGEPYFTVFSQLITGTAFSVRAFGFIRALYRLP